jgi:hypothetical protein
MWPWESFFPVRVYFLLCKMGMQAVLTLCLPQPISQCEGYLQTACHLPLQPAYHSKKCPQHLVLKTTGLLFWLFLSFWYIFLHLLVFFLREWPRKGQSCSWPGRNSGGPSQWERSWKQGISEVLSQSLGTHVISHSPTPLGRMSWNLGTVRRDAGQTWKLYSFIT